MAKLSLIQKFLLVIAGISVPIVLLASIALISTRFAERSLERIYQRQILPAVDLQELSALSSDTSYRVSGYLAGQFPAVGTRNKLTEDKSKIEALWKQYLAKIDQKELTEAERKLIQEVQAGLASALSVFVEKALSAISSENRDALGSILSDDWANVQTRFTRPVSQLLDAQNESIRGTYEFAKMRARQTTIGVFVGVGVAVIALALAVLMVRRLIALLRTVSTRISQTSHHVLQRSEHLSSASSHLSGTATEAASTLEESVASMEILSNQVEQNAKFAEEASRLSDDSLKHAKEGEAQVYGLINAMTELSTSAKKIEEIINVIDDIAFQTNLLALNAAVESARAGDQGKGFAVVAEAVRGLAHRSAEAAKDITQLIRESVNRTEKGHRIADDSGKALKNIVASVQKVTELNRGIHSASKSQATGIGQINSALTQLDHTVQSNASSSEEVASSSEDLATHVSSFEGMVKELGEVIHGRA